MDGVPSPKFGLALLGGFELVGPDGVVDPPGGKLAGLLAYLACTAPRPQSREKLATLLWGSHFDAQAKQNLRQALARLRRVLGLDALQGDGETVWLDAAAVECDVVRFEALIRQGSREALSAAVALYRGPLLDDVAVREEGFSEWLAVERERLLELALGALTRLGAQELAAGRAEQALKAGRRAIVLNNIREDAHRLIVRALVATGRKAEALKHYQDLAALLKRELSTEPDAATRALAAELRAPEPPGRSKAVETASAAPVRTAGPERRQLTILACTVAGATDPAVHSDPEDMRESIATFHKSVAEMVARFDGFVAQSMGKDVLVYFGYPAAHEHDTEQAVRAGLALGDAIEARVGIATGLVIVGEPPGVGDSDRRVAIGETPGLAARLQAVAAPGEVVIAAGTRRLVGKRFDCQPLDIGGVEAWQVRGEVAGVSRFEARRAGALSPLLGRQEEIDRLLSRWEQAKRGEGRVVLLSGEPGIGKSRIAEDLLRRVAGEWRTCLRYFCSPHHTQSPLHPFVAELAAGACFEADSVAAAKLDQLDALLRPTSKNAPRDVALLAELIGVAADGRYPPLAASPQQKRQMILAALLERLDGLAASGPVLIVFEDAHWIDPTSQELLDRMVARAADLSVLLVVTMRPERLPAWVGEPQVATLPLSRLGRRDSAGLLAGIAGDKALPDTVVEQVLAQADGVPLFIEELATTLIESGLLRETADRYVLDGALPPLIVPTTLQASLMARLDRLGPIKEVAQIGAAIGREFSHELIAAVSDLSTVDLEAALDRLAASGLVLRRGAPPIATYAFKHALVQDAAYATLLRTRRRALHASIAKVLVERYPAMAESLPELVAHHYSEAGVAPEAAGYWRKAGRRASARSANREAVSSFERALALLDAMPQSAFSLEQGIDIRLELRSSLQLLGEGRRFLERLREAESLAERSGDDRRRGHVGAFMASAHASFGEPDQAVVAGNRALAIARRLGDVAVGMVVTNALEQAHYYRGDYARVVELATANLAALPAGERRDDHFLDTAPPSIHDRRWLMFSLAQLGRFVEASGYESEAIRFAEATQNPSMIAYVHHAAGAHHLIAGDWTRARSLIERGIAAGRPADAEIMLGQLVACSAWALAEFGETDEALNRLREGEQLLDRHAAKGFVLAWNYHGLGRASVRLGLLDEARHLADRTIEASPHHPGFAAHALHLHGDIATHPDRFDAERGEDYYHRALALAEPRGMRPLVAHCHLGVGKLHLRTSRQDQVRDHLTVAATMYRDMGMTYWLGEAEAARLQ